MTDRDKKERVFVYGTLLSGEPNNHRLNGATPLGNGSLVGEFKMIDLGAFPAVVREDGFLGEIEGEIYEVDRETLLGFLDRLEGVDRRDPTSDKGRGLYYRRELKVAVDTEDGLRIVEAWTYLMRPERARGNIIESGSWSRKNAA